MYIGSTETVLAGEALMLQISASYIIRFDYPEPPTNISSTLNLPVSVNPVLLSHTGCFFISYCIK